MLICAVTNHRKSFRRSQTPLQSGMRTLCLAHSKNEIHYHQQFVHLSLKLQSFSFHWHAYCYPLPPWSTRWPMALIEALYCWTWRIRQYGSGNPFRVVPYLSNDMSSGMCLLKEEGSIEELEGLESRPQKVLPTVMPFTREEVERSVESV